MELEDTGLGSIIRAFEAGDIWMLIILGPALFGNLLAIIAVPFGFYAKKKMVFQVLGLLSLLTALGLMALGGMGYGLNMMELNEALLFAAPEHQSEMIAYGKKLAGYPLKFGLGAAVLPMVASIMLLGKRLSWREPE